MSYDYPTTLRRGVVAAVWHGGMNRRAADFKLAPLHPAKQAVADAEAIVREAYRAVRDGLA